MRHISFEALICLLCTLGGEKSIKSTCVPYQRKMRELNKIAARWRLEQGSSRGMKSFPSQYANQLSSVNNVNKIKPRADCEE